MTSQLGVFSQQTIVTNTPEELLRASKIYQIKTNVIFSLTQNIKINVNFIEILQGKYMKTYI